MFNLKKFRRPGARAALLGAVWLAAAGWSAAGESGVRPRSGELEQTEGAPAVKFTARWLNPGNQQQLERVFPGSFLVACNPGGTVEVTAAAGALPARFVSAELEAGGAAGSMCQALEGGARLQVVAPPDSGAATYRVKLAFAGGEREARLCAYVPYRASLSAGTYGKLSVRGKYLGPYSDAEKSGVEKVRLNAESYVPPRLFFEITSNVAELLVSRSFRLQDLVVPDADTGKRHCDFAPVSYRLLDALETFCDAVEGQGFPRGAVKLISVWRDPLHNSDIGSGTFSRHKYMDAFDVVIDGDGDGDMDDLNLDGRKDKLDALFVLALAEELQFKGAIPVGGLGAYVFSGGDYSSTCHIDLRGHRARWAYYFNRRGKRAEFGWNSIRFAAEDKAEAEKRPGLASPGNLDLPKLRKPVELGK